MSDKPLRLTPALSAQIVASIRAGGYPHVAAEASGVPKEVFDDWLQRGNEKGAWEPYRSFARDVRQAFAQARLRAEITGFEKDPKLWLVNGPGRESEQQPGWSVSVKPAETTPESRNVLCDPELMRLFNLLLEVLTPFPEARAQVAQALLSLGMKLGGEDSETGRQGDKETGDKS